MAGPCRPCARLPDFDYQPRFRKQPARVRSGIAMTGMKASGIGRDGGDYSFEFYMETKNVALAHGTHTIPKLGR